MPDTLTRADQKRIKAIDDWAKTYLSTDATLLLILKTQIENAVQAARQEQAK